MSEEPHITIKDVLEAVAMHYGVTPAAIRSSRKDALLSRARHVACWLAGRLTETSNMGIGRELHCDHTVSIRGRREIEELRERDTAVADLLTGLEAAVLAVAQLRARQVAPQPRHIDPFEVAARVIEGGPRVAGMVAIDEIAAVCETLRSYAEQRDHRARYEQLRQLAARVAEKKATLARVAYTPGEKHAREQFEGALNALSKHLLTSELEQANG